MQRADEIRKEILFQAYALRPLSVTAARIERQARKQQMDFTQSEIARELPFLVGEKLLMEAPQPGVSERHYTITSDGVKHYENTFAP